MANGTALILDQLAEGDSTFREESQIEYIVNARFIKLFSKFKKGWFIFRENEVPLLTREQITEVIVENNLVRPGTNVSVATAEAISKTYHIDVGDFYKFTKLVNGSGSERYQIRYGCFGL